MNNLVRLSRAVVALITLLGILPLALPASAGPDDPWTFEGGGWGHGVGLSQYGAKGQAEEGRTAEEILQHYYGQDSSIATPLPADHWLNQADGLWVGLESNATSVSLAAIGDQVHLCQPSLDCSHVDQWINPGEPWVFEYDTSAPDMCRFRHVGVTNTGWSLCDAIVEQDQGTTIRIDVDGTQHAHGTVRFSPLATGFHAILMVDLESYLHGLSEMPSSWHTTALEVQAIAGRTFAVGTAIKRGGTEGTTVWSVCGCHIRSTSIDQVYRGWTKENPANGGVRWVAAVDTTAGQVLTHPQSWLPFDVVETFYSSSNGGASENNEDVWGGTPRPWLRSVVDPWSADPSINPLATWTVLVSNSDMETALGWDRVFDAETLTGPPGVIVRFSGKDAGILISGDLNGTDIRSILNTYGYKADGSSVRVSPYISKVTAPSAPFTDIEASVFENAIEWLYEENITVGCNPPGNTLFCPNRKVTRGEMGIFISRAIGLPVPSGDHFTDDDGTFWEGGANRMYEAGITVGCGGTNYCGHLNLPREQMAVFIVRALDLPPTSVDYFTDDNNSPFEDHINRIAEAKITLGCNPPTNDHFCPNDTVTRGEMAAFIKRAWGP